MRPSPSVRVRRICAKLPQYLYNTRARVCLQSRWGVFLDFFQVQLFVSSRLKLIEITYDDYNALMRAYGGKKYVCALKNN